MFKKILERKLLSIVVAVALIGGGYYGYQKLFVTTVATRYVTVAVEKGTLVVSIAGSGQVSALNQVDVKARVSGDIVAVGVKNGQEIKSGALVAQVDSRDAQKAVRDAEVSLESARLSLDKLKQPADAYSILQAENSLTNTRDNLLKLRLSQQTDYQKTQDAKQKAEDNIAKAYDDSFNAISGAFLNFPTMITAFNDILYSKEIGKSESAVGKDLWNISALINTVSTDYANKLTTFQVAAESDYKSARSKYDANFEHYKSASRYSDRATIESLLSETLETARAMAQAAKSESNYLDTWVDYRSTNNLTIFSKVKEYQANLATYIGQANNHLSNLLSIQRTLQDNREALVGAERDLKEMDQNNPLDLVAAESALKEKEASLTKLKSGPDALDIQSQELSVKQRENALQDAKEKLADYYIHAPFDGVVAKTNIKAGDPVSTGTILATLITKQRLAEVPLNEIDVAKIKIGQKATLIFDAVPDLSITGEVVEIDAIGATTQGVVNYGVKISFDTQDDRIKSGMSVSAAIITDVRQDVMLVSNSAVKSIGGLSHVEILVNGAPQSQSVEIGLSNDAKTEILSGLKAGDKVITQTITASATKTTTTQSSGLRIPGLGGGR